MNTVVRLTLLQTRRDRAELTAWILGIAGLGYAAAAAVTTQFGGATDRAALMTVAAASPAFLFLRGLPDGIDIGAVTFFQGYSFTAVLAGLMSTFLVTRHTRDDEDQGRAELVGSTPVNRAAPLQATLALGAGANMVLAAVVAAGFMSAGLPTSGSVLAGAAVGAVGLFFMSVAALIAQIMPTARSANGVAAAAVGAAYLARGVGDALGTADASLLRVMAAWPSLLSPIGWGQRVRPFTEADPLPLVALTAVGVVLAVLAVALRKGRDLGDSYVAAKDSGPAQAGSGLRSMLGLSWRLHRGTLAGWCVAAAALGAVAGTLGPLVRDALSGNPSLMELMARIVPGDAGMVDLFTTALLGIAGILAAAAGIQAALKLRAEEVEGRAEQLLAVPASRSRWVSGNLVVAALSTTAVATVAGTAAAVALSLTQAGGSGPGAVFAAALAHIPAAIVFPAITVLAFALIPRWSSSIGWGALGAALVLGQFGELLGLPAWLQDLSPFRHSSAMPVEAFNPGGALLMAAIAVTGSAAAAYLIRQRDLTA
ncbi:UNVERIFIED_CONTAM: ABC-2 type transport system permease protein [Jeotgalibacillus campisalis]